MMLVSDSHQRQARSSLKRSACDRCRTHKLRCPRDTNYATACKRCERANVRCTTGAPKPPGRPVRSTAPTEQQGPTLSEAAGMAGELHRGGIKDTAPGPLSMREQYTHLTPDSWGRTGAEPATASLPRLHDPTHTPEDPHEDINGAGMLPLDMILGGDTDFLKTAFAQGKRGDAPAPPPDTIQGAMDWLDTLWPLEPESGRSTPAASASTSRAPRPSSSPSSSRLGGQSDDGDRNVASDASFQLCRFNLILSKQLSFFTTGPWEDPLAATTSLEAISGSPGRQAQSEQPDQPSMLGDVLRRASEFISILQQFKLAMASGTEATTRQPRPQRLSFPPPGWGSPTESANHVSPWPSPSTSTATPAPGTLAAFVANATPELSMATALSLLSSHLHLMAMYNALFRRIRASLSRIPAASIPALQVVPGLHLAGFPVHHGGLQIKMLIQVIEHHLETIDGALGLPAKYRVRRGGVRTPQVARGNGGLLEGSEFETLLDVVMGGNGAGPALGPGLRTILSLRQNIDNVERYLG